MDWDDIRAGCAVIVGLIVAIALIFGLVYIVQNLPSEFERRDQIAQECFLSERYSREECILLASGE